MRLIDADAIQWTDLNADMPNSKIKVLVAFADKINRMPTIEPQRTGRWIDGKCSECGTHAPYWAMASTYYLSEYCPHCGARMEGEQE